MKLTRKQLASLVESEVKNLGKGRLVTESLDLDGAYERLSQAMFEFIEAHMEAHDKMPPADESEAENEHELAQNACWALADEVQGFCEGFMEGSGFQHIQHFR